MWAISFLCPPDRLAELKVTPFVFFHQQTCHFKSSQLWLWPGQPVVTWPTGIVFNLFHQPSTSLESSISRCLSNWNRPACWKVGFPFTVRITFHAQICRSNLSSLSLMCHVIRLCSPLRRLLLDRASESKCCAFLHAIIRCLYQHMYHRQRSFVRSFVRLISICCSIKFTNNLCLFVANKFQVFEQFF